MQIVRNIFLLQTWNRKVVIRMILLSLPPLLDLVLSAASQDVGPYFIWSLLLYIIKAPVESSGVQWRWLQRVRDCPASVGALEALPPFLALLFWQRSTHTLVALLRSSSLIWFEIVRTAVSRLPAPLEEAAPGDVA